MKVEDIHWWHTMDLGNGIVTKGISDWRSKIDQVLPGDLSGMSVLDIGAWDGAMSFEAKRRGADRVVALDYDIWVNGWGKNKDGKAEEKKEEKKEDKASK